MFIRKTVKKYGQKTYVNYLLVQAVSTPRGPRQKTIVSLGDLSPGPKEKWVELCRRIEASLQGQMNLDGPHPAVEVIVARIRTRASTASTKGLPKTAQGEEVVAVLTNEVSHENAREAGPVHVGHQMWERLGIGKILEEVGLPRRAQQLSEIMTLNRLISPSSEHAMPDWIRRTALADILRLDFTTLSDETLYRNLDHLYPNRARIETALAKREQTLFNLADSYYFYDLTSTYFEGQCLGNPKAKRGYSRDHRPDCKQVVVGLVVDRDGFPKAHEIFDGNRQDRMTLDEMLGILETRTGHRGGGTVIVDRGMAHAENLKQIKERGHHYVTATRQSDRNDWLDDFEEEGGWEEIVRQPSPRNPAQKKTKVQIKRQSRGEEIYVLCRSEGRAEKDRAIRKKHEQRFLADVAKLQARVAGGKLKKTEKIYEAIGRLKERYPRVARYHHLSYDPAKMELSSQEDLARKQKAEQVDGAYLLRTDRTDMSADEIWRLYILLTRVEDAFRDMKSPLSERPIFHHLQRRVETHIFLCVLAYHLLVSIEKAFLDRGIHTSWGTIREQLQSHQVVTIVLPTTSGDMLKIRKAGTPEPEHQEIYDILAMPREVMAPIKMWLPTEEDSDGKRAQVPVKQGNP